MCDTYCTNSVHCEGCPEYEDREERMKGKKELDEWNKLVEEHNKSIKARR